MSGNSPTTSRSNPPSRKANNLHFPYRFLLGLAYRVQRRCAAVVQQIRRYLHFSLRHSLPFVRVDELLHRLYLALVQFPPRRAVRHTVHVKRLLVILVTRQLHVLPPLAFRNCGGLSALAPIAPRSQPAALGKVTDYRRPITGISM